MMSRMRLLTAIALCLLLSACGGGSKNTGTLLPEHGQVKEPTDEQLTIAIQRYVADKGAPPASRFKFVRNDLNGDRRRDAVVLMNAPYGYWCGENGCEMLVFKASENDFTLVNAIKPVRPPVYISANMNNGWKDLVTRVSGREDKAKDVILKYRDGHYPSDPSQLYSSQIYVMNNPFYTRIFYEDW